MSYYTDIEFTDPCSWCGEEIPVDADFSAWIDVHSMVAMIAKFCSPKCLGDWTIETKELKKGE
jgi:hypothetical protein